MKETIVYLPVPHRVPDSAGLPSDQAYTPLEVFEALDAAGVRWVQESPEELKIRMMALQIEELKRAYVELQGENAALKDRNAAQEKTIRRDLNVISEMEGENEERNCAYLELQSQLKEAQTENGSLAGLLADTQKHVDELDDQIEELKRAYLELQDQNAALKMTISDKSKQIERLERGPNANW